MSEVYDIYLIYVLKKGICLCMKFISTHIKKKLYLVFSCTLKIYIVHIFIMYYLFQTKLYENIVNFLFNCIYFKTLLQGTKNS